MCGHRGVSYTVCRYVPLALPYRRYGWHDARLEHGSGKDDIDGGGQSDGMGTGKRCRIWSI